MEGELERGVRATLTRATNELNRIDYRVLNADAKIQYDTAKRFIRQADDAVRTKNLRVREEPRRQSRDDCGSVGRTVARYTPN